MPDFPRRDLTGIIVKISCPADGCTLDTPCQSCTDTLADAAATVAARRTQPD
jgi:hypothetical protein